MYYFNSITKSIQSLIVFTLLMLTFVNGFSQTKTSLLEKEISVSVNNEKTDVALNRIAQKGGFSFSYNSSIIDINKTVTVNAQNKSVREILNGMFNGKLIYKEKGNYIILSKAPLKLSDEKVKPELIIVSGYIVDEKTGNKIPAVTIYDKVTRTSVISDDYGYYTIKLNRKDPQIQLVVNKHNYSDTVLTLTAVKNQYVNVYIKPLYANNDSLLTDSFYVDENQLAILLADAEQRINTENVKDTLHSEFQFSVLPYLGTNMKMSGSVTNDYSFNLLGGYSMGTNYFEFGGLMNSNRANVSYGQIAGITNIVGGNVLGFQMAGVTNIVKGSVTGGQVAGCVNLNDSDVYALQVAGLVNVNRGKTIAGQVAGLINYNTDTVTGISIAGLGNNSLKHNDGVQIGGLFNYVQNTMNGVQVAGLYNYAKKVNGVQIGFLNISDSCNGVPIGFLSFVNHGYHKIEFSADEIFYTNMAFRTGTHYFHNLLQAGMRPDNKSLKTWYVGYGLGTTARLNNRLNFDFDLSANQISEGPMLEHMSLLNKAYIGFEFQIAKKFSMALGATMNAYFTDLKYDDYPKLFTDFNPNIFYQENINNRYNVKMWMGGKVALRVL